MTLLILDGGRGPLPPYLDWLGEVDAVLFTARSRAELDGHDTTGYAEVRSFADYATSGRVEREAVRLARGRTIRAIVALAAEDAIRAGALRDQLGVDGEGREDAIALRDLVAQRARRRQGGIPTVPCAPVQRVSDLYWLGHRWGYPLRVRHRRRPGWPTAALLGGEADVAAFTRGGLSPRLESVPSLLAEPAGGADRRRVVLTLHHGQGEPRFPAPPAVAAALARLAPSDAGAWRVQLECGEPDDDRRIDAIAREAGHERALARAQAGVERGIAEAVR